MNEPLRITLSDAASLLTAERIPFVLIGALAVSVHSEPRVTSDVDMIIDADLERAVALAGALEEARFKPLFQDVAEVVQRSFVLPLRHRQTNVKLESCNWAIGVRKTGGGSR